MNRVLSIFLILLSSLGWSQLDVLFLEQNSYSRYEKNLYHPKQGNFHTSVRPYLRQDIDATNLNDTLPKILIYKYQDGSGLFTKNNIRITPLISGEMGSADKTTLGYSGGVKIDASFKKFGFTGSYRFLNAPNFNYQDSLSYINDAVNGFGINYLDTNGLATHHAEFYLVFKPNKYFEMMAGNGQHFWGDGYRSVFLSDNAAPYPFFRLNSTFWNVKYTNLFSMHRDDVYNGTSRKFAATHQLSWNISKTVNFSIFESVVWSGYDTLIDRGFDINYVNPIIFYRPVEYFQGSTDNVFFGASSKWTIKNHHVLYGQLLLDEFLISEIRAQNGWWANKYAIQFGLKSFDLGIDGLSAQAEWNMTRPFMYAHNISLRNYGHAGQSLAHPLGASFEEVVLRTRYIKNKWNLSAKVIYQHRGEDFNNVSYGGNIYNSYVNRIGDYNFAIGDGETHYIWWNELSLHYLLSERLNINAFLTYAHRSDRYNGNHDRQNIIRLGIQSSFWNRYEDY